MCVKLPEAHNVMTGPNTLMAHWKLVGIDGLKQPKSLFGEEEPGNMVDNDFLGNSGKRWGWRWIHLNRDAKVPLV
jgi:hypothetical protein